MSDQMKSMLLFGRGFLLGTAFSVIVAQSRDNYM